MLMRLKKSLNLTDEGFRDDWFGDVPVKARRQHLVAVSDHGEGRDRDKRDRAQSGMAFQPAGDFVTIHAWELNVTDDQLDRVFPYELKSAFAVVRIPRRMAKRRQKISHKVEIRWIIFNYQNISHDHVVGCCLLKKFQGKHTALPIFAL